MTDPLTPARFAELADAYGAVIARWPDAVRADAIRMAADPAMRAVLEDAARLDARLDRWTVPAPTAALRQAIVAGRRISWSRRARLWWSGLGIATAIAGAAAGSFAVSAAVPIDHSTADDTTIFGNLAAGQED